MAKISLGRELANRFTRFADALEQTADPVQRFTIRGTRIAEPPPHDPKLIRSTRDLLRASQPVFAGLLGVSVASLRDWEQGVNEPPGSARRLMTAIRTQPEFWAEQLALLVMPSSDSKAKLPARNARRRRAKPVKRRANAQR